MPRQLLHCFLVLALSLPTWATEPSSQPIAQLDHLVVGVADLMRAVTEFEEQTGVKAVMGGEHPGIGTHNALVSLGDGAYLELIAVKPGADAPQYASLRSLTQPTPMMWAVTYFDLAAITAVLAKGGFKPTTTQPGSRKTPAGSLLEWEVFGLEGSFAGAPFFIRWLPDTAQPSTTSPGGCTLAKLAITTPEAAKLERLKKVLGLVLEVSAGEKPGMQVVLRCPKGEITMPAR